MSTLEHNVMHCTKLNSTTHPYAQIALLALNRPKARNALSRSLIDALQGAIHQVSADDRVRGVILTSTTPGMFCAGADLVERRTMAPQQVSDFLEDMRATFTQLTKLSVPTISVIDGHALGGGLELGLCTDIRIMGPLARVGLPETKLGIIPGAGGTQRLTRLIGASRTKELVFAARVLDGREAVSHGIGSHYVDDPYEKAIEMMESFIRNSPTGISQAKKAIDYATEDHPLESGLDFERAMYDNCMAGPDRNEGLLAFKEKRKPIYGLPAQSQIKAKL
ncbi:putative Mitochondrial methylglutaconyl-CoA hydratase [Taphrina deformans PYCC 5710]|uniref:Mitochondrial methylglutaconyl-CoA hydratase n=1 Tax=Taphrina deformans (strain PYCC 5710 / ATCC 11124 / CBS 356.35 / IMI 108563 / JCM 9778 / NBRC 8474) TaxID=1097556 RepID=R4XHP2_TAPDE|nr:putative Mitochondrial methylglutaconyl-CoA hydratase [Taphrina deformans PYCC 5710]|eukprot:CCG85164.1 putative Mitochondrial methylglutaconyl-CoA hydratase [Taphrina deformans PYCC 5710]